MQLAQGNATSVAESDSQARIGGIARARKPIFAAMVAERDHGVCADCGRDMLALKAAFDGWRRTTGDHYGVRTWREASAWCEFNRVPFARMKSRWWDADHIVAVCEGGSDDLSNFRTLCLGCHRERTKALLRKLTAARLASPAPIDRTQRCVACGHARSTHGGVTGAGRCPTVGPWGRREMFASKLSRFALAAHSRAAR